MLFFPLPGSYAVVGIDVENTLQPLNDPAASASGALIKTTNCIVYLDMVLGLPLPHDAYFKYMACLVGPGLRPAYPELCITPDMCIPILPNTRHPNADHIRIVNDGRDYGIRPRTALPADQHVKMVGIQDRHMRQSCCARKERDGMQRPAEASAQAEERDSHPSLVERMRSCTIQKAQSSPPTVEAEDVSYVGFDEHAELKACRHPCEPCVGACCADDNYEDSDEHSSHSSSDSEGSCDCDFNDCTETLDDMCIVGLNGDPQDYLLPFVKLSLDVGAYFNGDADVPNRMEFMRQRDALIRIIEESKLLAKKALEDTKSIIAA